MIKKERSPVNIRLLLIVIGVTGILLSNQQSGFTAVQHGIAVIIFIVQLTVLEMLLRESDIFRTVYFRLIQICISIYIIGALCRIMHWQGADLLLSISLFSVAGIYFLRMINKSSIRFIDISKWLWVTAACLSAVFNILHKSYALLFGWANLVLFILMFILFIIAPSAEKSEEQEYEELPIDQID